MATCKPATTLGRLTSNKDNNFNLIRILAALAVLVSHSYALTGHPNDEPLTKMFSDFNFGKVAVDIFLSPADF